MRPRSDPKCSDGDNASNLVYETSHDITLMPDLSSTEGSNMRKLVTILVTLSLTLVVAAAPAAAEGPSQTPPPKPVSPNPVPSKDC